MDSEDIDRKIEAVGSELFDDITRNWLTNILTKYHTKVSPVTVTMPVSLPVVDAGGAGSGSGSGSQSPRPGSSSSSASRPSSPDPEPELQGSGLSGTGTGIAGKPRSRKSTSIENGGKRKKDSSNSSHSTVEPDSVLKTELIVYTMGHLVSNDSLIIPRQTTVLGFKATYELSLASEEKLDLTKSVIVKLIDDDDAWDDYNEEDKENQAKNNNSDSDQAAARPIDVFNANICEYNFYMKIVPGIEAWAASRGVPFKFGIPHCIHGQYIPGTHSRKSPFLLDSLSTLVLDDLCENEGYVMRNPGLEGLPIEKLKLAIVEIAKIHAVSWAYQECIGMSLKEKHKNCFEDLHEQAVDFGEDIEESTPEIEAFFKERGGDDAERLLAKITTSLLPNIQQAVEDCLIPKPTQGEGVQPLTCLVHSNFWHQNLMFKDTGTRSKHTHKSKHTSDGEESDCDHDRDRDRESGRDSDREEEPSSDEGAGKKEPCARILDWDNVNVSQPMIDVACLLFRSASPKVRREHLDEFMELYANTFQSTAQFLRIPTIYDLDYFKEQYRKCAIFPIFLVMGTMALTLCDETAMELFMQGLLDCEVDHLP